MGNEVASCICNKKATGDEIPFMIAKASASIHEDAVAIRRDEDAVAVRRNCLAAGIKVAMLTFEAPDEWDERLDEVGILLGLSTNVKLLGPPHSVENTFERILKQVKGERNSGPEATQFFQLGFSMMHATAPGAAIEQGTEAFQDQWAIVVEAFMSVENFFDPEYKGRIESLTVELAGFIDDKLSTDMQQKFHVARSNLPDSMIR